jgi:hypothetical protein
MSRVEPIREASTLDRRAGLGRISLGLAGCCRRGRKVGGRVKRLLVAGKAQGDVVRWDSNA